MLADWIVQDLGASMKQGDEWCARRWLRLGRQASPVVYPSAPKPRLANKSSCDTHLLLPHQAAAAAAAARATGPTRSLIAWRRPPPCCRLSVLLDFVYLLLWRRRCCSPSIGRHRLDGPMTLQRNGSSDVQARKPRGVASRHDASLIDPLDQLPLATRLPGATRSD